MKNYYFIVVLLVATVSLADYSTPLEDTYQTLSLWDMDDIVTLDSNEVVIDSNTAEIRIANNLKFFNGSSPGGTLTAGQGGFGNAASFDGVNDYAKSTQEIYVMENFKFEAWIKTDSSTTNSQCWIADVSDTWRIFTNYAGSRINFYVKDVSPAWRQILNVQITANAWQHITAGVEDGLMYLSVDGGDYDELTLSYDINNEGEKQYLWIGRYSQGENYYFKGLIDDVRLSDPANTGTFEWNQPLGNSYDTMALWDMDVLVSDAVIDRNDSYPYRDAVNLDFFSGASLVTGQSGFGNAASFDGVNGYAKSATTVTLTENFKFEAWVKTDSNYLDQAWIVEFPSVWRVFTNYAGTRINMYVLDNAFVWNKILNVPIIPDEWNHITAGVYDGKMFLSVDKTGNCVESALPNGIKGVGWQNNLWVGRYSGGGNYFKGLIDDVRLTDTGIVPEDWLAPLPDTDQTLGLWEMGAIVDFNQFKVVVDKNNYYPYRQYNHLRFYDGTTPNGTLVAGQNGFGNAAYLDGINDFARTDLEVDITADFEFEAWIKPDSNDSGNGYIADMYDVWRVFTNYNGAKINFYVKDTSPVWNQILNVDVVPDQWNHITAGVEDGVMYLSVDDRLNYSDKALSNGIVNRIGQDDYLWIGRYNAGGYHFGGLIDDVRLMDTTTLYSQASMKTPETSNHFRKWVDTSGTVSYLLKTSLAYHQQSFYYINRSMTDDGRFLLFSCIDSPKNERTLGVVDFQTDEIYTYPQINSYEATPYLDVNTADIYWATENGVFKRSLLSHCECTNIQISDVPIAIPDPQYRFYQLACHLTRNASKTEFFLDSRVDNEFICGDMDIATGNYTEWDQMDFFYNHAQFSPTDDDMVLICKDYWNDAVTGEPYVIPTNQQGIYERLWLWERGQNPQLIAPINGGNATHEWWGADGTCFYYCAYPQYGIARYNLQTAQSSMITTNRATHAHCSADGRYFVFDQCIGDFYRGCPWKVFFYDSQTQNLATIVTYSPAIATAENPSPLHPDAHPNFVCDDKYIVCTLNIDGAMNILVTPVAELIALTQ